MAKNDCRHYQKIFNSIVKNQIPVTGTKYKKEVSEVITDATKYRQCYKKGSKIREQLPKYWFVSKEGFLINVKGSPTWTKPNTDPDRPEFKVSYKGKGYPLATYNLVGLVWGCYISADAQKLLDKYGLKVFGRNKKTKGQHAPKVQGHHVGECYKHEKTRENYIANNNPEILQIITNREHTIVGSLTGDFQTDVKKFYKEDMLNVLDDSLKIYLPDEHRMMPLEEASRYQFEIQDISADPTEHDSCIIGDYIFVLENGRAFLEEHKKLIKDNLLTDKNIENGNNYEIHKGKKYFYCSFLGRKLYYRKIK